MSKRTILSEKFSGAAAVALLEHRDDREAVLESITHSLLGDQCVRAAWLGGSFERGDEDDLSDLDLWLVVADDCVADMSASLLAYALRTGHYIWGSENPRNAPAGGGYFTCRYEARHGLVQMDCYWQPLSTVLPQKIHAAKAAPFLEEDETISKHAFLIDRRALPFTVGTRVMARSEPSQPLPEDEERIGDAIGFAWTMIPIAAKNLARDPGYDMALMLYPRPGLEEAALLLGLEDFFLESDWTVPENPIGKIKALRKLADKTDSLVETASSRGIILSRRQTGCIHSYLDMIESVLL